MAEIKCDEVDPEECVDGNGDIRPEHDYSTYGDTVCSRCGAEADQ